AFELCILLALGGVDRWSWTGGWGLGASLALQTSLGMVGSWVVAIALFFASALAASELGFHWIGALMHRALVSPAQGAVPAYGSWMATRGGRARLAAKRGTRPQQGSARDEREARRKPRSAAVAVANEDEDDTGPAPPRISGREEAGRAAVQA